MNYVIGIILSDNRKEVLLIEKLKPAWQKGLLNFPGGKIEPGESPEDAFIREIKEETDLTITNWKELFTLKGNDWKVHIFQSYEDLSKAKQMEEEALKTYRVEDILTGREKTIDNIPMILAAALFDKSLKQLNY